VLRFSFDIAALQDLLAFRDRTLVALRGAARDLSIMGHARAMELARDRLRSRRRLYTDALSMSQVDDSTWFITLNARAMWIEEGKRAGSMLDDLLKSPKAKTAKDGSRYVIVPFRHGPAEQGPESQQPIVDAVKAEMKRRGIPWANVERDESGRPLLGRLHSFNVNAPVKTGSGPAQGWGAVGDVRRGPSTRQLAVLGSRDHMTGPAHDGTPFLQNVSVYQRDVGGKVKRDIMTFRVASSKHRGQGRWVHPGMEGVKILDQVHDWLSKTWETEVMPRVMQELGGRG